MCVKRLRESNDMKLIPVHKHVSDYIGEKTIYQINLYNWIPTNKLNCLIKYQYSVFIKKHKMQINL